MGFIRQIFRYWKVMSNLSSVFGKRKITIKKTINTKLKEYVLLIVTIQKYSLKNLPQMLLCIAYCHQKAKYYKHITVQQLDLTCWKMSNLRESPTTPETDYCIDKRIIKVKTALKGRPKNHSKDCTCTQFPFFSNKIWWYSIWSEIGWC